MTGSPSPSVRTGGTPVWIDGEGPTLVMAHGVLMDHRMWAPLVNLLTDRYRVVRFDMLGHGQASDPPGQRTLDDFLGQVDEIITAHSPDPPVLIGFSMGGLIAQAYAVRSAFKLRGLVLMNAVYDRSETEQQTVRTRRRLMHDEGAEGAIGSARERWFSLEERDARSNETEGILEWIREGDFAPKMKAYEVFATGDRETLGRLGDVNVPALVMTGADDSGSTPRMTRAMAQALPAATCYIAPGQRHMMPVMDAPGIARVLQEFLDGLPQSPA